MFRAKVGVQDAFKKADESAQSVDAFIRIQRVSELVSLSRAAIYERIAKGTFPAPVPTGSGRVAWVESEVRRWMSDCVARRDAGASNDERA